MKKIFLLTFLILAVCFNSNKIFAQDVPGGSASDGQSVKGIAGRSIGTTVQPLGYHFTINNSDGACNGRTEIKMFYKTTPTVAPVLNQIYYRKSPLFSNFQPIVGNINSSKGCVSFCLSKFALPPAMKLRITYSPSSDQQEDTINGNQ